MSQGFNLEIMRKTYVKPSIKAHKVNTNNIMCASYDPCHHRGDDRGPKGGDGQRYDEPHIIPPGYQDHRSKFGNCW